MMSNMMSHTRTLSGLACRSRRHYCIIPCRNNTLSSFDSMTIMMMKKTKIPQNNMTSNLTTTKRKLSSSTSSSTTAGAVEKVVTIPVIEIPNVVSRRVWQQQYEKYTKLKDSQQKKNPIKSTASSTSSTPTPPWPKSIQIIGYITGFIIVPYVTIWGIVSNDTLRDDYIFPALHDNNIQDHLREHYGEKDLHSISYYDLVQYHHHNDNERIPYKLLNESNIFIRQQQNIIDHEQNISSHLLSVRFHGSDNINNNKISINNEPVVLHNVPASIRVNYNNLKQLIQDAISNISKYSSSATINNGNNLQQKEFLSLLLQDGCNIGIDFPYNNNPNQQEEQLQQMSQLSSMTMSDNIEEQYANQKVNILKSQMNVYSLWHYQNPDNVIRQINSKDDMNNNNNTSSSSSTSNTTQQYNNNHHNKEYINLRIEQLKYEIIELENEMKFGNRTIDSITEQLNPKKQELRQLQYEISWWKFW